VKVVDIFRSKKREYLKAKINECETNSKNKNVGDLYRDFRDSKMVTCLELTYSMEQSPS
jgi:hypothetical protein